MYKNIDTKTVWQSVSTGFHVFALFAALNTVQKETKGPLWQHVNVSLSLYKNSHHESTKQRVKPLRLLQ